jgi:hypothetical protein
MSEFKLPAMEKVVGWLAVFESLREFCVPVGLAGEDLSWRSSSLDGAGEATN